MRILLAPDKFKGTFTAAEVCRHLRAGILEADPSAVVTAHPLADGGEGTLDVTLAALGGERIPIASLGPLGEPIQGEVGRLPDGRILVESALFCGLGLVPPERRNPLRASTYGLGLVLREVLSWRPPQVLIGLGGSASVDGGMAAGRALGFRPLDDGGNLLDGAGGDLVRLSRVIPPSLAVVPPGTQVRALCDVDNALLGPRGAAAVFAPQKGASPEVCRLLETGLNRFAEILERASGVRIGDLAGTAAAGGTGAGIRAFLGASLERGSAVLMEMTRFEADLEVADLVVTGEGACDIGEHSGKVVPEVVRASVRRGIQVVVVCGHWAGGRPAQEVKVVAHGSMMSEVDLRNAGKSLVRRGFLT